MIRATKLTKYFDEQQIFEDVSFEVGENTGLFITGPSGCGKTTLLRILAGFDTDYSGQILIDGTEIQKELEPRNRNIAIVFQEPTLWNHMSVEQNISYGMKIKDKKELEMVAQKLQIEDLLRKYPEEISGGQAKRVSLARALLSGKKNLLLDEPLSNVDPKTKEIILEFLRQEYLDKKCVLYITHDRDEIGSLPFDVMEMKI
nr:ATP-binding cassette domain-containing protein [uncultured Butyrivibrio sp.]